MSNEIEKDLDILDLQSKINCNLKKQNIFDGINLDCSEEAIYWSRREILEMFYIKPIKSLESLTPLNNYHYNNNNIGKEKINFYAYLQYLELNKELNKEKMVENWLIVAQETIRREIANSIGEEKLCICRLPKIECLDLDKSCLGKEIKHFCITDIYGITYLITEHKYYLLMQIICNIKNKNESLSDVKHSVFFI